MKVSFKILLAFFVFLTAFSCKAQLVQTVNDVKRLEINQDKFVGKPLSDLLKQIKPEIKRVMIVPGSSQRLTALYFYFLSDSDFHKFYKETGKNPLELRVRLKEYDFKWDPSTRPQDQRYDWTKEDEKEFGKLTVADVKVRYAD